MKPNFVNLSNKGMQQDNSISKTQNDFAFENVNIRITADKEGTQLSVTNEKTPGNIDIYEEYESYYFRPICMVDSYIVSSLGRKRLEIVLEYPLPADAEFDVNVTFKRPEDDSTFARTIRVFGQVDYDNILRSANLFGTETGEVVNVETFLVGDTSTPILQTIQEYSDNIVFYYKTSEKPSGWIPKSDPVLSIHPFHPQTKIVGINKSTEYITLFMTVPEDSNEANRDAIFRIRYDSNSQSLYVRRMFNGNLGFTESMSVDTLFYYETEDVQKVYWVDGVHEPRVINIVNPGLYNDPNDFSFYPVIANIPTITVEKDYSYSGVFACGTIQYFVTYYNKFGAETLIVNGTDLNYLSFRDRGAKADENVYCGMKITISELDTSFDYVRIYAAQRTSEDGPIDARIVTEIALSESNGTVSFVDLGKGDTIDSALLQFIGGQKFIPKTIDCKDDTLFAGNITLDETELPKDIQIQFASSAYELQHIEDLGIDIQESKLITFGTKFVEAPDESGYYSYTPQIKNSQKTFSTFKAGEIYRFALQFMTKTGSWTLPVWIGDKYCDVKPSYGYPEGEQQKKQFAVADAKVDLQTFLEEYPGLNNYIRSNYIAARLLCAQTDNNTRQILAQGIVNPTLFNYEERFYNEPYAIPSWNFRLRNSSAPYRHLENIGCAWRNYGEIQGTDREKIPAMNKTLGEKWDKFKYFSLLLGLDPGHEGIAVLIYFSLPEDKDTITELFESGNNTKLQKYNSSVTDLDVTPYYLAEATDNVNTAKWDKTIQKIYEQVEQKHESMWQTIFNSQGSAPLFHVQKDTFPNRNEIKKVISSKHGTEIAKAIAAAVIAAAATVASVFSFGAAAAPAAGLMAVGIAALYATSTIALGAAVVGTALAVKSAVTAGRDIKLDKADKLMANKGWLYLGKRDDAESMFRDKFANSEGIQQKIHDAFAGGSYWCTGGLTANLTDYAEEDASNKSDQYFIDNSIITLNSPDLDNTKDIINNNSSLGFRIVGYVPIDANYMDYTLIAGVGYNKQSRVINNYKENTALGGEVESEFTNGELYIDGDFSTITAGQAPSANIAGYTKYKVFLWHGPYASVAGDHELRFASPTTGSEDFGAIEKKIFANQLYGFDTVYLPQPWSPEDGITTPKVYNYDGNVLDLDLEDYDLTVYSPRYDTAMVIPKTENDLGYLAIAPSVLQDNGWYPSGNWYSDNSMRNFTPIRIQFDSLPHVSLSFKEHSDQTTVLPTIGEEPKTDILEIYKSAGNFGEGIKDAATYSVPWRQRTTVFGDVPKDVCALLYPDKTLYYLVAEESTTYTFYGRNNTAGIFPFKQTVEYQIPTDEEYTTGETVTKIYCRLNIDLNGNERITVDPQHPDDPAYDQGPALNFYKEIVGLLANTVYNDTIPDGAAGSPPNVDGTGNDPKLGILYSFKHGYLHQAYEDLLNTYAFVVKMQIPILEDGSYVYKNNETDPVPAIWQIGGSLKTQVGILSFEPDTQTISYLGGTTTRTYWKIRFDYYVEDDFNPIQEKIYRNFIIRNGYYRSSSPSTWYGQFRGAVQAQITKNGPVNVNKESSYSLVTSSEGDLKPYFFDLSTYEDTILLPEDTQTPTTYLYIGELYKKTLDYSTLYGGTSKYALQKLSWNVCSDSIPVPTDDEEFQIIENTYGDTYFQRWDCLKSVPLTENTQNGIVEICSVMLESHTNLDGRCDINRGISNIINARIDTWDLINPAYSQQNNIFQYNILDEKFSLNKFKNQIWWSSVKLPSSNVDTWTNMNALSSVNVDGKYGEIRKLLTVGSNLMFFQDSAIGVVNYNNRTQISTESGQPLEVINSGKVNGISYYDTTSGTVNKDSIVKTSLGVFYIDNFKQALKIISAEGSVDIGLSCNMSVWLKEHLLSDTESYISQYCDYDDILGDIYIHGGIEGDDDVLVFNERLKLFTTTFHTVNNIVGYEQLRPAPYRELFGNYSQMRMFNLQGKRLAFGLQHRSPGQGVFGRIYEMGAGDKYYPYRITYQINPNPLTDKLFTNVEFVADFFDDTVDSLDNFYEGDPFKTIRVWNEYQDSGIESIANVEEPEFIAPDTNRKFRIRRLQIPRASKIGVNATFRMDRIRNPWCYIKLDSNPQTNPNDLIDKRMVFHNMVVKYFE